ncbi:MAG TPA: sigma-70 family RNA polymerase sigma factor [Propionibacteriaceae bacterium]|nr:sigma-70 family RNA polymerase sigma factor [Propionibacteriaceae bacterium]
MQRVGRGDQAAFAELYDATSELVYGAALQVLRSPRQASEVTQEVYLEVWRSAGRYHPTNGSVLAWLTAMAHRHFVDRARAVGDEPVSERHAVVKGNRELAHAEDGGVPRLDAERARKALHTLSDGHRQVVTLAYVKGCSQSEVARTLGLPLDTVTTRLRDGLRGLRHALGAER